MAKESEWHNKKKSVDYLDTLRTQYIMADVKPS